MLIFLFAIENFFSVIFSLFIDFYSVFSFILQMYDTIGLYTYKTVS